MGQKVESTRFFVAIVTTIVTLVIIGLIFALFLLYQKNTTLTAKVADLQVSLKNSDMNFEVAKKEKTDLINALNAAADKNKAFSDQLDTVTNTVERYQRLSQLDPQLLEKYSKVNFLNENYIPSELTFIDTKFLSDANKKLEVHDRMWPFLNNMLNDAERGGLVLKVTSAYRSFGTQASLKSNYKVIYGTGSANQFSADQGYSEHQLGTTIDVTTPTIGGGLTGFDKTKEYTWLIENAYKYGFILSYPKNNAYYVYEPWHWRFVGLDLALRLHSENIYFYDLDQRDINTYLINIFSSQTLQPKLP